MALIKCPECKNQISELASNCPNCGFPLSEEIILRIKADEKKEIENQLRIKEKKERESREFLDSLGGVMIPKVLMLFKRKLFLKMTIIRKK